MGIRGSLLGVVSLAQSGHFLMKSVSCFERPGHHTDILAPSLTTHLVNRSFNTAFLYVAGSSQGGVKWLPSCKFQ